MLNVFIFSASPCSLHSESTPGVDLLESCSEAPTHGPLGGAGLP